MISTKLNSSLCKRPECGFLVLLSDTMVAKSFQGVK